MNKEMYELGSSPSAIRELFAYGLERKAQVGEENVFDFSIGNPSVDTPLEITECLQDLLKMPPSILHAYTPASGMQGVRAELADSINSRFAMNADAANIFMTVGAAASLSISLKAICTEGSEVIVIAPFFPEYLVWIEQAGAKCVLVEAEQNSFQLDIDSIKSAITDNTTAIIINSPNNPTGVIYTKDSLESLAAVLNAKQKEFNKNIYIIADEPYRELVYTKDEPAFIPSIYNNTLLCYSYSKSLSLPGERIGYIYVSERMNKSSEVFLAIAGAARALGFICAPAIFQFLIEKCHNVHVDTAMYRKNRDLLSSELEKLGFEFAKPEGAFYLWIKCKGEDEQYFCQRAKAHDLLIVPSTSFGTKGYARVSYCVAEEVIRNSIYAFTKLADEFLSDDV